MYRFIVFLVLMLGASQASAAPHLGSGSGGGGGDGHTKTVPGGSHTWVQVKCPTGDGFCGYAEMIFDPTQNGGTLTVNRLVVTSHPGENAHFHIDNPGGFTAGSPGANNLFTVADSSVEPDTLFVVKDDAVLHPVLTLDPVTKAAIVPLFQNAEAAASIVGPNITPASFSAISDGTFTMSIDGVEQDITGLDFQATTDADDIAAVVQAALQAVGSGGYSDATCTANGNKLTITSGSVGLSSSVSLLTVQGTGTDVSALLRLDAGDGVITNGRAVSEIWKIGATGGLEVSALTINQVGDDGDRYQTMKIRGTLDCDGVSACGAWDARYRIAVENSAGGFTDRISGHSNTPTVIHAGDGLYSGGLWLDDHDGFESTHIVGETRTGLDATKYALRSIEDMTGTDLSTGPIHYVAAEDTTNTVCETIHFGGFTATEESPVIIPGYDINITRVYAFCEDAGAGDATFTVSRCTGVDKGAGPACADEIAVISACDADSTLDEDLTLTNTAVSAGQMVWSNVTAVGTGGTDNAIIVVCYERNLVE